MVHYLHVIQVDILKKIYKNLRAVLGINLKFEDNSSEFYKSTCSKGVTLHSTYYAKLFFILILTEGLCQAEFNQTLLVYFFPL